MFDVPNRKRPGLTYPASVGEDGPAGAPGLESNSDLFLVFSTLKNRCQRVQSSPSKG